MQSRMKAMYDFRQVDGVWQRKRIGGRGSVWQKLTFEDKVINYRGNSDGKRVSRPREIVVKEWVWVDI